MDLLRQFGDQLVCALSDMESRLAALYLCSSVVIAADNAAVREAGAR